MFLIDSGDILDCSDDPKVLHMTITDPVDWNIVKRLCFVVRRGGLVFIRMPAVDGGPDFNHVQVLID